MVNVVCDHEQGWWLPAADGPLLIWRAGYDYARDRKMKQRISNTNLTVTITECLDEEQDGLICE
ncbi:hypothetical protein ACJX0J_022591 [Zea mays]